MSSIELGSPEALVQFTTKVGSELTKALKNQNLIGPISNDNLKVKSFECSICQKKFVKRSQFQHHLKSHWFKLHHCQTCDKSFLTKQGLKVHSIVHGDVNKRPFSCQYCLKTFQTKQNLTNHENIHLGRKPFQCFNCNKCFRERSTLRKHMVTHSTTKKYLCTLCEKRFTQLSSQQRHIAKFHDCVPRYGEFLPSLGAEIVAKELMVLESSC